MFLHCAAEDNDNLHRIYNFETEYFRNVTGGLIQWEICPIFKTKVVLLSKKKTEVINFGPGQYHGRLFATLPMHIYHKHKNVVVIEEESSLCKMGNRVCTKKSWEKNNKDFNKEPRICKIA